MVKNLPALRETRVWSLSWEDPLEKSMATHSSILAWWRIPWTEEPGGLQSMESEESDVTECLSTRYLTVANECRGMHVPHFVYLSAGGRLGCFHFLAFVNNTAGNVCVQVLVWTCFISIRSGWSCWCGNSMLNLWRNCQTVFQSGWTILHSWRVWGFLIFHILDHSCSHLPLWLQLSRSQISLCFDLRLPDGKWCWASFPSAYWLCMSSLEKRLHKLCPVHPLLFEWAVLLLLKRRSSLYVLDSSLFSDIRFAKNCLPFCELSFPFLGGILQSTKVLSSVKPSLFLSDCAFGIII